MLLRAARQKAQCETARSTKLATNLNKSWICSTQIRFQNEQRRLNASDARPRPIGLQSRRDGHDIPSTTTRRSMATAVDNYGIIEDIPFEDLGNDMYRSTPYSDLRAFNPSTVLMISDSLAAAPTKYRMFRGIGGEQRDMVAVMRVCLQIGRLRRAGAILHRLATVKIDREDLLEYHNEYLEVAVANLIAKPSETASLALHKWFEMELNQNVDANADSVALMLKASMQSPPGSRRDRLVRRYMDIVPKDVGLEALTIGGILSDEELAHITQIAPDFNVQREENGINDNEALLKEIRQAEPIADTEPPQQTETPHVMAAKQKGYGLKALKEALSLFSNNSGHDITGSDARLQRQYRLEEDSIRSAIERWRQENADMAKLGLNSSLQSKNIGARMWSWQVALQERLGKELDKVDRSEKKENKTSRDTERCLYGPFLKSVPVEKLSAVTILATMGALTSLGVEKGITLSSAIMTIGHNVEDESMAEALRTMSKTGGLGDSIAKKTRKKRLDEMLKRIRKDKHRYHGTLSQTLSDNREPWNPQWSATIRAKVGAVLLECLLDTALVPVSHTDPSTGETVSQLQPALSHSHQYKLGRKVGVVMVNPALTSQLLREPVHALLVKHLPMVVEPAPWSRFNKGGFLATPATVMRIKLGDKDQRHYVEAAIAKGDLDQVFKGLDVLGKTPWKINQGVFDTMLEAWNTGEAVANLAPSNPQLEYPPEPPAVQDPTARRRWAQEVKLVENQKSSFHSQRCFQNFQLEIARALKYETFYFPHNVDFRGRAYPIPPYLNHMGADHCRGLLEFGEGKPLGETGLKWLKIHLANVFGFDKASLSEREAFAMEHHSDIIDSATNPLNGERWWLQAEDAWQTLAACFELKAALESPDPTTYVSHLPVHQDGTCNGLQHYAALGGDEWGARQVNLIPGDRPADVYTAVADLVKESLAEDLERGYPCAEILNGKITRKVVKQTVMTNVYGVTYIGAKAQVRKQLTAAYPDLPNNDQMNAGVLAAYIATKIFQALSTMFRGAHDIQYWLGNCASRISVALTAEQIIRFEDEYNSMNEDGTSGKKDLETAVERNFQFRSSVIWTTPLHMPVVQPYRISQSKSVQTNLQNISLSEPHRSDPVSKRKQLQGFPPNFVHSLDATHMLLSALKCDALGLSFAAVHDSFWTHAADIDIMNGVLRDAFVQIHSEDVIGRLAAEFEVRYSGCFYKKILKFGTEAASKVITLRRSAAYRLMISKYVPGSGKDKSSLHALELILEKKRIQLLQSSDPKEVEEGRSMVTPASLCEYENDTPSEELSGLALGDMSSGKEVEDKSTSTTTGTEDMDEPLSGHKAADVDELSLIDGAEDMDINESTTNISQTEKNAQYELLELRVRNAVQSGSSARFSSHLNNTQRKRSSGTHQFVWAPLTFPPVPKKGNFNVERLKESHYFFS